jgi:flagellar motor switch protein FliM
MASEFSELASQVLSQDEIESLLQQFAGTSDVAAIEEQVSSGKAPAEILQQAAAPRPTGLRRNVNFPRINFRVPAYLKRRQLRFLEVRTDQFARQLTDRLSLYLRKEVKIELSQFETLKFDDLKARVEGPHYFAEIKVEGFPVNGFMQIPVEMGLLVIDRMLGGTGEKFQGKGGLTEIEVVLLDQLVGHIMDQWALIWEDLLVCRHRIVGHESEIGHLHITSGLNPVISSLFKLRIGTYEGEFRLVFPAVFWEPILSRVNETILARTQEQGEGSELNNEAMMKLKLTIKAKWEGHQMTARELGAMKPGDCIYFNRSQASRTTVVVADLDKFIGLIGEADGKRAIQIEKVIESKKPNE